MKTLERFEPLGVYRKGDRVLDDVDMPSDLDTEPGGVFEAAADFRAGFLNPRYVAKDRPGEFWVRV